MNPEYPRYNIAFIHAAIGQFKQLHIHLNQHKVANAYTFCSPGVYNKESKNISNLRVFGTVPEKVKNQFFYITKIDESVRRGFGVKESIEKLMKEVNLDLIVSHVSGGPAFMMFDEIDVPVVSYVEFPSFRHYGWDPRYPPPEFARWRDKMMEMYYNHVCLKSDHIITPSEYAKTMIPQELHYKTTSVMEGFKLKPPAKELPITKEKGKTYIGFTARDLSSAKGFEQFIKIAKAILKKRKEVKFVIIGSPKVLYSYEGATLDKIYGEKHGKTFKDYLWEREKIDTEFKEFFEFYDFMPYDKYHAYVHAIDFFLYPLQKGSANWGVYELYCRGKIIIGSERCYMPELITHEIDGFLCPYDDINTWVETAIQLIDQPQKYEYLKRNILINAKKYHIENIAQDYMKVFHEVIIKRRHGTRQEIHTHLDQTIVVNTEDSQTQNNVAPATPAKVSKPRKSTSRKKSKPDQDAAKSE